MDCARGELELEISYHFDDCLFADGCDVVDTEAEVVCDVAVVMRSIFGRVGLATLASC